MRKTYFQLNILRRNCSKKYGKNQVRQDVKRALKAKKEARAIKQAQREEKKRNKRGKIYKKIINFYKFLYFEFELVWFHFSETNDDEDYDEEFEDESLNEVFDASALEEMGLIQQSLSGKISTQSLQARFYQLFYW